MEIQIHPIVFIAAIVVPALIIAGVVMWVALVQKKNLKKNNELKSQNSRLLERERENMLWETLVTQKDKHISVLREKLDK